MQDHILERLAKGHTHEDFVAALGLCQRVGLPLNPTFVAFTPWTSLADYLELLTRLAELGLIDHVSPIQLAMRLLIPAGSKLLDLPDIHEVISGFDEVALTYRWLHPDVRVDRLCDDAIQLVQSGEAEGASRQEIFSRLWAAAHKAAALPTTATASAYAGPATWPHSLPQRTVVLLSRADCGAGGSVLTPAVVNQRLAFLGARASHPPEKRQHGRAPRVRQQKMAVWEKARMYDHPRQRVSCAH